MGANMPKKNLTCSFIKQIKAREKDTVAGYSRFSVYICYIYLLERDD